LPREFPAFFVLDDGFDIIDIERFDEVMDNFDFDFIANFEGIHVLLFHWRIKEIFRYCLRSLTTDTSGELDVLGHDGNTLGMDGAQVGVLEESNKVSLSSLLKSKDGRTLESKVSLEVLGDFTDKSLEGELSDQKIGGLLVSSNFTKSDSTRSVSVSPLDTSSGGGILAGSLGGKLLTGGLSSGRFTGSLLGTGTIVIETILLVVTAILFAILIRDIIITGESSSKSI
jgi:histone H3